MAYAPLARDVAEAVVGCAVEAVAPDHRLRLSRLLADAGLLEEAAAAAGAAADDYEVMGDREGAAAASLAMAQHLAHLGFDDLALDRFERAAATVAGMPVGSDLHHQARQVMRCLDALRTHRPCGP